MFTPLDSVTHYPDKWLLNGLVVRADRLGKNMQEFIQYAKQNPRKFHTELPASDISHLAMEE